MLFYVMIHLYYLKVIGLLQGLVLSVHVRLLQINKEHKMSNLSSTKAHIFRNTYGLPRLDANAYCNPLKPEVWSPVVMKHIVLS